MDHEGALFPSLCPTGPHLLTVKELGRSPRVRDFEPVEKERKQDGRGTYTHFQSPKYSRGGALVSILQMRNLRVKPGS